MISLKGHGPSTSDETDQIDSKKIPLDPPFIKGEDSGTLLYKRRAGEDFEELFIPSFTPYPCGVRGSQ
jgi:hypothetical protein